MRKSKAFTLVELLVVIGIIALLISILLPSLNAARKQAATVKCASALKEIGNAFQLYAMENKGAYPPSQLLPGTGKVYNVNGLDYPNSGLGAYWFNFLAKYVTKTKVGLEAQNGDQTGQARGRSIFWNCPAFEGYYTGSAAGGGYNRVQPGYGMNWWPTMQPDAPAIGVNYNLPTKDNTNYIQNWGTTSQTGTFFKQTVYGKNGSQRALIADSRLWAIDGEAPPASGVLPGQPIPTAATFTTVAGQTLMAVYRHGTNPKPATADTFQKTGGKAVFNVLYCDGHVATSNDISEAYRSIRLRFPG